MVMSRLVIIGAVLLAMVSTTATRAQQTTPKFGGAYAGLDEPRQQLINDWISRFVKTTGQSDGPGSETVQRRERGPTDTGMHSAE